ncbi:MAG: hypothetical protein ACOYN3_07245, partial [Acidimicrobiia bacterium]
RLHDTGHAVDGVVINRVLPQFGGAIPMHLRARAASLAVLATVDGPSGRSPEGCAAAERLAAQVGVLADLRTIAAREQALTNDLAALAPEAARVAVPRLAGDVHDVPTLRQVAQILTGAPHPNSGD